MNETGLDNERQTSGGEGEGRQVPRWLRPVLVVVLFAGLFAVGRMCGLYEDLTLPGIREKVLAAGPWGVLVLIGLFVIGLLIQIPGIPFVVACLLIYGPLYGIALSYASGMLGLAVSFFVVRRVGGQPLGRVRFKWMKRALSHLDERPVRTVILLRFVAHFSPVLTYALALSGIRFRDFMLGSLVGVTPIILVLALLAERAEAWLS